jgi:type IV pilus assembly protein PilA
VVLIIAILIAIAIPTFLGARERAQNRAAQSDLRNGLTAEKTVYTDEERYADADDDLNTDTEVDLLAVEPSLEFSNAAADLNNDMIHVTLGSVTAGDNAVVCLEKKSKSGSFFALADVATGANAGTYYKDGTAAGVCQTNAANFTTANGWDKTGW